MHRSRCFSRRNIRSSERRAAASVEAALVLPVLVLVTLLSVDVSQYLHAHMVVSNASREGARMASRYEVETTYDVKQAIVDYVTNAFPNIASDTITGAVKVSLSDGASEMNGDLTTLDSGQPMQITVTFDFTKVRWLNMGMVSLNGSDLSITTHCRRD